MQLKDILRGKRISILGDSISTYTGISNDTNANATIGKNSVYYNQSLLQVNDTWWMRLINKYDMNLCVNNSWSGGLLCNYLPDYMEDCKSGEFRANELADRAGNLPDIIIVFMGMNDLGHSIDAEKFGNSYKSVLQTISKKYPNATVFCISLFDREIRYKNLAQKQDAAMRNAIASAGSKFHYIDLFHSILNNECYMENAFEDGLHPSASGMKIIADLIEDGLKVLENE